MSATTYWKRTPLTAVGECNILARNAPKGLARGSICGSTRLKAILIEHLNYQNLG
ncbi:MAG: hypothetical protein M3299_14870 [Thermoproteota archaeon]|nr:hypothetical protein [Thermoproteota archaeon]